MKYKRGDVILHYGTFVYLVLKVDFDVKLYTLWLVGKKTGKAYLYKDEEEYCTYLKDANLNEI